MAYFHGFFGEILCGALHLNYELPLQKGTGFDRSFLTKVMPRKDVNPLIRVEFIAI